MDFYEKFTPKKGFKESNSRLQKIKTMMEERRELPAIELYKVKDEYYVLDGHHRVVAAKEIGRASVDAHVVEYLPKGENPQDQLFRAKTFFEIQTKLEQIHLTQSNSYNTLLKEIETYKKRSQAKKELISTEDAARRWYNRVYKPRTQMIEEAELPQFFDCLTPGDIYACTIRHQERLRRKQDEQSTDETIQDSRFKQLIKTLSIIIDKDPQLESEETIIQLEKIIPPCLYLKHCPRWPEDEPKPTNMRRIKEAISHALT